MRGHVEQLPVLSTTFPFSFSEPQEQLGLTGQPKALTANEASSPAAFNYLNRKWQNRPRGRISLSSHFYSGCFPFPEAADGLLPGRRGSGQASPGFGNGVSWRVTLPLPGSCGGKALGPFPSWRWLHLPGDAGLLWGFSGLWPERAFSRCKPSQPKTQLCPAKGSPGWGGAPASLVLVLCVRPSSSRGSSAVRICALLVPDAEGNLSGGQAGESHTGLGSQPRGERSRTPTGWVRNLFTSISRYMRPFFFSFLFTIIVTQVNPSINRQI